VAKTCQPNERVWARKVSFPSATFAPGAGLKTELRGLADVPRLREADRKTGGNQQQNYNTGIVPDQVEKRKKNANRSEV
jgi:hypothetical protein